MKHILLVTIFILLGRSLSAQVISIAPDTLLNETFELDPTNQMLIFPNGDDIFWVNWDEDKAETDCAVDEEGAPTVSTWYWEYDLSDTSLIKNNAFTSCSFGVSPFRSKNWLMAPPVFVADSAYVLSWRSSAYQGPFVVDGYHVLVSETGNFPENFKDTLFNAAETTTPYNEAFNMGLPLNVALYTFSPGYLQANAYTDPAYYFLNENSDYDFYQGKLEPHRVWLKNYVGKTIYVAFLHDSYDDFILQVDDILVARDSLITATHNLAQSFGFQAQPNPVTDFATLYWNLPADAEVSIRIYGATGQLCWASSSLDKTTRKCRVDLSNLPAGVYYSVLNSGTGIATLRLLKL